MKMTDLTQLAQQCRAGGGQWKEDRCVKPYSLPKSVGKKFKNKVITLAIVIILGLSMLLLVDTSTFLHEVAGHTLVAKLFGCKTDAQADTFTGHTTFYDCMLESNTMNIIIAFASIFVIFSIATALWIFFNENSLVRILAIIMMMYSAIPSAFPLLPGSDMAYALGQGFPIWLGWMLYIFIAGTFLWLLIEEVTDIKFFNKFIN